MAFLKYSPSLAEACMNNCSLEETALRLLGSHTLMLYSQHVDIDPHAKMNVLAGSAASWGDCMPAEGKSTPDLRAEQAKYAMVWDVSNWRQSVVYDGDASTGIPHTQACPPLGLCISEGWDSHWLWLSINCTFSQTASAYALCHELVGNGSESAAVTPFEWFL